MRRCQLLPKFLLTKEAVVKAVEVVKAWKNRTKQGEKMNVPPYLTSVLWAKVL